MHVEQGEFTISTEADRLQIDTIHDFLTRKAYWARDRTLRQTETAIKNSICFGLYHGDRQIGFARVISDKATFAYIGDLFVLDEFRGKGLSKWLMETIIGHSDLQDLRRWLLATKDAHGLYAKFEFASLRFPDRWMEKTAPDAY